MKISCLFIFVFLITLPLKAQEVTDSLSFKIGQMIMVGLEGSSLNPADSLRQHLEEGLVGGIIFFEKNVDRQQSGKNMQKLVEDLQEVSMSPLLIGIDEEGGLVHRLKKKYGFVDMPSAEYLGQLNNFDSTFFYANRLSSLLKELGININFAPVVDLATNPNNPVIAKIHRSYSADPDSVAFHAEAFILASKSHDVIPVIKHFPGHGSSTTDSHWGITDVSETWQLEEIFPYSNLIGKEIVDAVMSAHIINRHLDTDSLPATLSKDVLTGLLRMVMGFDGVIFSDDMQMHAISKHYGFENGIRLGLQAGLDVLVFANNVTGSEKKSARMIHNLITDLVESGEISEERIDQSYRRIKKLKEDYGIWSSVPGDPAPGFR